MSETKNTLRINNWSSCPGPREKGGQNWVPHNILLCIEREGGHFIWFCPGRALSKLSSVLGMAYVSSPSLSSVSLSLSPNAVLSWIHSCAPEYAGRGDSLLLWGPGSVNSAAREGEKVNSEPLSQQYHQTQHQTMALIIIIKMMNQDNYVKLW